MSSPDLSKRRSSLEAQFEARFGVRPLVVANAPGRVNLIGEHTDYNGGLVLPMAIDRTVLMAVAPSNDESSTVKSLNLDEEVALLAGWEFEAAEVSWVQYVRGVVKLFADDPPALNIMIESDIPPGAGLSSSAALEVSTLKMLESLTGRSLAPMEGVKLCQRAEHDFAGVPCGIMDQTASIYGKADRAVLLDCATETVEHRPLSTTDIAFLVVDSMESHALRDGGYASRRQNCEEAAELLGVPHLSAIAVSDFDTLNTCLTETLLKRARHVVTENERVRGFCLAAASDDWQRAGELLYESHTSLRDDFDVSTARLDFLVEAARDTGVQKGIYGCRMTGGGFGGAVVVLVDRNSVSAAAEVLKSRFLDKFGVTPDVLNVSPSPGAAVMTSS